MKNEPHRSPRHHEAAQPVIHHYEDDQTVLLRWLRRGAAKGTKFWLLVGGVVVVAVGLMMLANGLASGQSETSRAWMEAMLARGPDDLQKLAGEYPSTPAAQWALLQAAEARYREAFADLPANRDAAMATLNQAYEGFKKVDQDAPDDAPQKRLAILGMGRTLEARGELDDAIERYQRIASTKAWAGTAEAEAAGRHLRQLRTPEAVAFYKQFSTFKPREIAVPPLGSQTVPIDPMPAGGVPTSAIPEPPQASPLVPPPAAESPAGGGLPADVFPKPAPAATNPPATTGGELPADPFPAAHPPQPAPPPAGELPSDPFPRPANGPSGG